MLKLEVHNSRLKLDESGQLVAPVNWALELPSSPPPGLVV